MTQSTYTIVAGDGQNYGPNAHDVIQSWINEGRIARDTQMARSDVEGWFRAGDYQEFTWPAAAATPAAAAPAPANSVRANFEQVNPADLAGVGAAASWLFWIAGLSLVNFGLTLVGSDVSFAIGCIMVDVAAALSKESSPLFALAGVLLIAIFAGLGYFARKAHLWALVAGLLIYAVDSLLVIPFFSPIAAALHAWILFKLVVGVKSAWSAKRSSRNNG